MSKKILITFAGREQRMSILGDYAQELLRKKSIDEWHIWDFTRNESDREYLKTLGHLYYMETNSGYQYYKDVKVNSNIKFSINIGGNFYLALVPKSGDTFIETLVGGWGNGKTVSRVLNKECLVNANRSSDPKDWIYSRETPGVCSQTAPLNVRVVREVNKETTIHIDRWQFVIPAEYDVDETYSLYIRSAFGATMELMDERSQKIKRFVGNLDEGNPNFRAYQFYAKRFDTYKNDIFVKCDDDIVYLEIEKFNNYVKFTKQNDQFFLVSANVVNNAACAYQQQLNGMIPKSIAEFNDPAPTGKAYIGDKILRENGAIAEELHHFFIDKKAASLPLVKRYIECDNRIAINFVAWNGNKLKYMSIPHGDDEAMLTGIIPQNLGFKIAIYSDFMVSHLSFDAQEPNMDINALIKKYGQLKKTKYKI